MPLCIALVPSSASPLLWSPCARRTPWSDHFCAGHRLALIGALMGLANTENSHHAQNSYEFEARRIAIRAYKKSQRARKKIQARRLRERRAKKENIKEARRQHAAALHLVGA